MAAMEAGTASGCCSTSGGGVGAGGGVGSWDAEGLFTSKAGCGGTIVEACGRVCMRALR